MNEINSCISSSLSYSIASAIRPLISHFYSILDCQPPGKISAGSKLVINNAASVVRVHNLHDRDRLLLVSWSFISQPIQKRYRARPSIDPSVLTYAGTALSIPECFIRYCFNFMNMLCDNNHSAIVCGTSIYSSRVKWKTPSYIHPQRVLPLKDSN